jgi:hypothetical protein
VIEWREAIERSTAAVEKAEEAAARGDYGGAQTFAQISYAWSNLAMMVEAQEAADAAAEAEAQDAVT